MVANHCGQTPSQRGTQTGNWRRTPGRALALSKARAPSATRGPRRTTARRTTGCPAWAEKDKSWLSEKDPSSGPHLHGSSSWKTNSHPNSSEKTKVVADDAHDLCRPGQCARNSWRTPATKGASGGAACMLSTNPPPISHWQTKRETDTKLTNQGQGFRWVLSGLRLGASSVHSKPTSNSLLGPGAKSDCPRSHAARFPSARPGRAGCGLALSAATLTSSCCPGQKLHAGSHVSWWRPDEEGKGNHAFLKRARQVKTRLQKWALLKPGGFRKCLWKCLWKCYGSDALLLLQAAGGWPFERGPWSIEALERRIALKYEKYNCGRKFFLDGKL